MKTTCPGCGSEAIMDMGSWIECKDCRMRFGNPVETPSSSTPPESILDEAKRLTAHDRNKDYGSPTVDFARAATIWSALLQTDVDATDVALCMIAVKLCRAANKSKRDNWVDIAGYARCGAICEGLEEL